MEIRTSGISNATVPTLNLSKITDAVEQTDLVSTHNPTLALANLLNREVRNIKIKMAQSFATMERAKGISG